MADWHDRVRMQLPDLEWNVDPDGDLWAEDALLGDEETRWCVWLCGDVMRLQVGCVTVESDVIDDYVNTAARLLRAAHAYEDLEDVGIDPGLYSHRLWISRDLPGTLWDRLAWAVRTASRRRPRVAREEARRALEEVCDTPHPLEVLARLARAEADRRGVDDTEGPEEREARTWRVLSETLRGSWSSRQTAALSTEAQAMREILVGLWRDAHPVPRTDWMGRGRTGPSVALVQRWTDEGLPTGDLLIAWGLVPPAGYLWPRLVAREALHRLALGERAGWPPPRALAISATLEATLQTGPGLDRGPFYAGGLLRGLEYRTRLAPLGAALHLRVASVLLTEDRETREARRSRILAHLLAGLRAGAVEVADG